MAGVEALSKKRAGLKARVNFYVGKLAPLLPLRGPEATERVAEVTDFLQKLETYVVKFKEAHQVYSEALEEVTAENQMDVVVGQLLEYENAVTETVYTTLENFKLFKARLDLNEAKVAFSEALHTYKGEMSSAESLLQEARSDSMFLSLPANETKLSLSKAYTELVKARTAYRESLEAAKENVVESIAAVEANFPTSGEQFRANYMGMRNKLGSVINGQNEARALRAAAPAPQAQDNSSSASPIKLEKAETVKFSGQPREFSKFKTEFNLIVVPNRSDTEIGLRLKQSVPTKHKHLVENYELSEHKRMMDKLEEHFGSSEKVVCSVVAEIERLKMPESDKAFVVFVEKLEAADRDLSALNLQGQVANEVQMSKLVERLPELVKGDWVRIVRTEKLLKKDTAFRYRRLMDFLSEMKDSVEYNLNLSELSSNKSSPKFSVITGRTLVATASQKDDKPGFKLNCVACKDLGEDTEHMMSGCRNWKRLSWQEKRDLVKCQKHPFQTSHNDEECERSVGECKICHEVDKHHTLMCDKGSARSYAASATSMSTSSGSNGQDVLLKTMFVRCEGTSRKVGLMQDSASTDNYVADKLVKDLDIKPIANVVLEIEGINETKTVDSKVYLVPLIDKRGNVRKIECYSLPEITADSKPIDKKNYREICKKLSVDPGSVKRPQKIDILLSARSTHLMSDSCKGVFGGLRLYNGPLGKTITGQVNMSSGELARTYPAKATPVLSCVKKAKLMKTFTDKQILDFFKEESIGVECSPKCGGCQCGQCPLDGRQMSIKEEKEYKMFLDNMYLDTDGTSDDPGPYWRTKYPWKIPREELVDNKEAVLGVMRSTERKLSKDPAWRSIYEQQLKDLLANKFAREVSEEELNSWVSGGKKCYYISHQMALNPASKSSPIRTVFNSSQVYKGYSLNSSWELGPDVTGSLNGILIRFREKVIGAQGDVRKMYYCCRVTKEEEFMQLFLWKFEGETKIRTFAMTRLVMGNRPSANASQIALRETGYINDNHIKFPAAANALARNSYVDNTFVGNDDLESVKEDIKAVEEVAAGAGFFYKPWVVSGQDVCDQMVVNSEDVEDERALGIMWCVKSDMFYVKVGASGKKIATVNILQIIENPKLKLTLRICLSLHAKAFDPLGLILPTKQLGNLLFRDTLQFLSGRAKEMNETDKNSKKLPWDFEVEGKLKEKWIEYFKMLESVKDVKFPRSIKPANVKPGTNPTLVTFSDGNEQCYGAVCYILWDLAEDSREARLIMSKAKLAPILNKGEVVKNELSGATFAARMKIWILQNTELNYGDHVPFLDSRIVQDMIKKESYILNTFAGVRVKEISAKTDVSSWCHIASKDNYVADILTRGETPDKLGPGSQWQCGPSWLVKDRDTWPVTVVMPTKEERDIVKTFERVTKTMTAKTVPAEELDIIDQVMVNCGSLVKAVNVIALFLRLRGRVGTKYKDTKFHQLSIKTKCDSHPVTALEHSEALLVIISHAQLELKRNKFQGFNLEDVERTLRSGKVVKLTVLRSRVQNFPARFGSEVDYVYPIPCGKLARKIAEMYHHKYHKDIDTVMTHIRKEFWIPQLRRILSQIDKNCRFCLLIRQKVSSQLMGSLPLERSIPGKAFEVTTLDLFGPLTIRDSCVKRGPRVKKKVFGVLFSCAASRAIQLDIAEDYSTQSFLHCVRRLMAERGQVAELISDPGTQLRGADRELKEMRDGWDQAELIRFGAQNKLEWKFVMAASQHQNGVTEILVKVVKGVMKSLMLAMGTTVLSLNELFTTMKEVQNLVNERPIGLKPTQQTDSQYLSPNSLLLGRCSDRISSGPFQSKASFQNDPNSDRTRFLLVQNITSQFWRNWTKLYFPTLLQRPKWHFEERNMRIGDVCLLKDSNAVRGEWRMCRVSQVFPDNQNRVRNVKVMLPRSGQDSSTKYRADTARGEVDRHVSNLIVIVPMEEKEHDETGKPGECEAGAQT